MFCPNCGEKLETPNQRFCASCGSEIQTTLPPEVPDVPQVPIEEPQVPPPAPIYAPKPIEVGGPGSYSKRTFAFAFLSLVLAVIGFILEFLAFFRFIIPIYVFPRLPGGPVLLIVALGFHYVGLTFGIVSKAISSKARKHEAENALEMVGRVFGIIGIIVNAVPIIIINIRLVFNSIVFSGILPIPY